MENISKTHTRTKKELDKNEAKREYILISWFALSTIPIFNCNTLASGILNELQALSNHISTEDDSVDTDNNIKMHMATAIE